MKASADALRAALQILRINSSATLKEVKNAYRVLAAQNHPDKFQNPIQKHAAAQNFLKIKEAYDLLRAQNYPLVFPGAAAFEDDVIPNTTYSSAAGDADFHCEFPHFSPRRKAAAVLAGSTVLFWILGASGVPQEILCTLILFLIFLSSFALLFFDASRSIWALLKQLIDGEAVTVRTVWPYAAFSLLLVSLLIFDYSFLFGKEYILLTLLFFLWSLTMAAFFFRVKKIFSTRTSKVFGSVSLACGIFAAVLMLKTPGMPKRVKTESVEVLLNAIRTDRPRLKDQAVEILERMGFRASTAIPVLQDEINSSGGDERKALEKALRIIQSETQLHDYQVLMEHLKSEKVGDQLSAIETLSKWGPKAQHAVPALEEAMKDSDREVADAAYMAIQSIQKLPPPEKTFPEAASLRTMDGAHALKTLEAVAGDIDTSKGRLKYYLEALSHPEDTVRMLAVQKIVDLGDRAGAAKEKLRELFESENPDLRIRAGCALFMLKEEVPGIPKLFIKGLENESAWVRFQCAYCLGDMGPKAKKALSKLKRLLKDPDSQVQMSAAAAIEKITPELKEEEKEVAVKKVRKSKSRE